MKSNSSATLCLLFFTLLSVSARRELQQRQTVTTFTSSSGPGAIARGSTSITSGSPAPKEPSDKTKKSSGASTSKKAVSKVRVDVYCLLDVTESTRGTLSKLRAEASSIVEEIFKTSDRVRFGVGEYKDDKETFSFTNHQTITSEEDKVVDALKDLDFVRGSVKAESQLYALERVAKDGDIGFRTKKSVKVIVWVGDTKGADPIAGSTEKSVIAALKAKDIYVVAIDTGSLDATKQATRIVKARGGALLKKNDANLYDVVLLETDSVKGEASGDEASVTTDGFSKPLSLSDAVVKSVKVIVKAAEA